MNEDLLLTEKQRAAREHAKNKLKERRADLRAIASLPESARAFSFILMDMGLGKPLYPEGAPLHNCALNLLHDIAEVCPNTAREIADNIFIKNGGLYE